MNTYHQGETFRQKANVKDISDGSDMDPDTIVVTIVDSAGTKQIDAQAMERDEPGQYHYDYNLADDASVGEWNTEIEADRGGAIAIEQDIFRVLKKL